MQSVLDEQIGEHQFRVYFDEDYFFHMEKDALCADILDDIKNGKYEVFGVEKLKKCDCCASFNHVDSLWGIIDTSPTNALKYFLENFN